MDTTSFLIYCMIATFTPGPTNIVILSIAHNYGAKKAIKYSYGATIGFSAFTTWVLFGAIFKELLQKYNKTVNVMMALFLAYAAIMIWM